MNEENLIFLISQPRSGSTYLQNLLSNNKVTNTCSEPWILLNFANQIKPSLVNSPFDNKLSEDAFRDYLEKHPILRFNETKKSFLMNIYAPMFKGFDFVIDKTPRYWEILDEIVELFPKSKIIILKRDPIDVVKSMIKTWDLNTLEKLNYFKRDLIIAPKTINDFCKRHKATKNVYSLRYEDIIDDTIQTIRNLYNWLTIPFDESVLDTSKNEKYKGKYGDPYQNSNKDYKEIKKELTQKELTQKDLTLKFVNFFIGYSHFLGSSFLKEYGDYHNNLKLKRTNCFDYFMFIGTYKNINTSFKSDLKWFIKKYYYKLILSKK